MSCVQSTMQCGSWDLWYITHKCFWCKTTHVQPFTCKRSICSSCSKPRVDKWINYTRSRLPTNISYAHYTFTLPEELRDLRIQYRQHWSLLILFNQAHKIIIDFFHERFGCKPWILSIIHTFGSAVNWNPHIHCVVTCWWIKEDDNGGRSWISIEKEYISYKHFTVKRRACVIKECRKLISIHDANSYERWNEIFMKLFFKSRYVTISEPIIDVVHIINYVTRYMYRPPLSLCNIVDYVDTWDIYTSKITVKFFHKKPKELRFVTYTMMEFIGLLARQIGNKYARSIRYWWIFIPQIRKKYLIYIQWPKQWEHTMNKTKREKIKQAPRNYEERIQKSFWYNPLHCSLCNMHMIPFSITFFSKKSQIFVTKFLDSS